MNELEMVTSKICSAREIIDASIDRIQEHQYDKAETMMCAAYEFLGYYLEEFDKKFKDAWQETVVKPKQEESDAWDAVMREKEYYEPSQQKEDKVVKWRLPVEQIIEEGIDNYYITFPDDLLEASNLKQGDEVEWHDQGDGSFILKKSPKTYDEMIAAGYTMTADGFWIKE